MRRVFDGEIAKGLTHLKKCSFMEKRQFYHASERAGCTRQRALPE